ncbi:hypothetical protein V8C86DRAFT_2748882, partial [Haematococcus lacustris]
MLLDRGVGVWMGVWTRVTLWVWVWVGTVACSRYGLHATLGLASWWLQNPGGAGHVHDPLHPNRDWGWGDMPSPPQAPCT